MNFVFKNSLAKQFSYRLSQLAFIGSFFILVGAGCAMTNTPQQNTAAKRSLPAQPPVKAETQTSSSKIVEESKKKNTESTIPSVPAVTSEAYNECMNHNYLTDGMYAEGQIIVMLSTSTKEQVTVAEFKKLGFDVSSKLGPKYSDLAWFWKPEWGLYDGVNNGKHAAERVDLGKKIEANDPNIQFAGINDYHNDARKIVNISMQVGLKEPILVTDFVKQMARYNLVPLEIDEPVDSGFKVLTIRKGEEMAWICYLTKVRPELVRGVFENSIMQSI